MILVGLVSCLSLGCDTAQPLSFDTHWSENQDLSNIETDFNWPVKKDYLSLSRPLPFAFIQQMDPQQIKWPKGDPNAKLDFEPFAPGLRRHLRDSFAEGEHSLPILMRVPSENLPGKFAFAISRSGSGLITVSDQLRIWDINSGTMRGEPKPLPSADVTAVMLDQNERHVIVADDEKLYRLSLPNGDVVNSIARPKGEIRQWLRASGSNVICALTDTGALFVCNDGLSQLELYPQRLSGESPKIAINFTGTELLIAAPPTLCTVPLNGLQFEKTFTILDTLTRDFLICNDRNKNYLFSNPFFYQANTVTECRESFGGRGSDIQKTKNFTASGFFWNPLDVAMPVDKQASWPAIIVLSQRQTKQKQTQYVLSEVLPRVRGMSSAAVLSECNSPSAIQLSDQGLRVAVYDSGSVRVYSRDERRFRDAELLREIGQHLVRHGTIEQIEALTDYLSRQGQSHFGLSPNELYAQFIDDAGRAWAELEKYQPNEVERIRRLDDWYRKGSEAALLLSAQRRIRAGYVDYINKEQHMAAAQEDLAPLNAAETPHTLANHLYTLAALKAVKLDSMEQNVRMSLESDASFFPTLYSVAFLVKPNWIQTKEDYPLYSSSIADLHGDQGDATYAKLIASVATPIAVKLMPKFPFDTERLFRGTHDLIESNQASADFLFGLGCIAAAYQNRDVATDVAMHIKRQIGFVPIKSDKPCDLQDFIIYVNNEK
ncbi:hypothetical protein CA13_07290 [Planctomycetes bacterium CA13]|uniref:Uncharacterized protein n=2 Tax=Novipirellula herctigrandis TaxID=2527986 RepID=A0A5C5YWT0_9BACT|nr:hypothetical protein CA13_07290 [Planctomycetes bacterium CA13]